MTSASRDPRREVIRSLLRVLSGARRSTDEVHQARQTLEPRDAALFQTLLLGVLRRRRALAEVLAPLLRRPLEETPAPLRESLMVLAFQALFLDRVPSHARLSSAVDLGRHFAGEAGARFINAVGRRLEKGIRERNPLEGLPGPVRASLPDWIADRVRQADRGPWDDGLWEAFARPAPTSLRLYPVPGGRAAVLERLHHQGMEGKATSWASWGVLASGPIPWSDERLVPGSMIPQDEASQLVVETLNPQNGERILDLCAGHGLKTLQILQLAPGAKVHAVDIHREKLRQARRMAARIGIPPFETLAMDARQLPGPLPPASFDAVLVDAPCTGLGTLIRRPEVRWTRKETDVHPAASLQREILVAATRMIRPDGRVLYAVCSFLEEEGANHLPLARELGLEPEAIFRPAPFRQPDGTLRTLPWRDGMDGFFMVVLRRR